MFHYFTSGIRTANALALIYKGASLLQQVVSMGKKPGQLPLLGLASLPGQGDSDPCLSRGFLYRICSVIIRFKIPTDGEMVRGKGMVMGDGAAVRV